MAVLSVFLAVVLTRKHGFSNYHFDYPKYRVFIYILLAKNHRATTSFTSGANRPIKLASIFFFPHPMVYPWYCITPAVTLNIWFFHSSLKKALLEAQSKEGTGSPGSWCWYVLYCRHLTPINSILNRHSRVSGLHPVVIFCTGLRVPLFRTLSLPILFMKLSTTISHLTETMLPVLCHFHQIKMD